MKLTKMERGMIEDAMAFSMRIEEAAALAERANPESAPNLTDVHIAFCQFSLSIITRLKREFYFNHSTYKTLATQIAGGDIEGVIETIESLERIEPVKYDDSDKTH